VAATSPDLGTGAHRRHRGCRARRTCVGRPPQVPLTTLLTESTIFIAVGERVVGLAERTLMRTERKIGFGEALRLSE
jgi:hypothetical protein